MVLDALFLVNHLSPIAEQNAATFGDPMPNSRRVVLTGTAQLNILVGDVFGYEQTIAQELRNRGWDIVSLRITKQTTFTNQINLTIEANVNLQYTAEDARQYAEIDLADISGQSWIYGSGLLTNIHLRILTDSSTTTTQDTTDHNDISDIINSIGGILKGGAKNAADNAGTFLGLSIGTIALLGIGYLVISKRR